MVLSNRDSDMVVGEMEGQREGDTAKACASGTEFWYLKVSENKRTNGIQGKATHSNSYLATLITCRILATTCQGSAQLAGEAWNWRSPRARIDIASQQ